MSLMFTDVITSISGDTEEIQCEIHPDWLSFSVIEYDFQGETDAIFEHLPPMTFTDAARHHEHAYVGHGVRINHQAKASCNNYDLEIELRGKYLRDYDYKSFIDCICNNGGKIRLLFCTLN